MRRFLIGLFAFCFSASVFAIAPALIWIGETIATVTAESIAVNVVTKGFAANDPYVPSRAVIPVSNLSRTFRAKGGFSINPYWAAFAVAAGIYFESGEFKKNEEVGGYLWSVNATGAVQPNIIIGEPDVNSMLAILPTSRITQVVEIVPPTNIPTPFNCNFSSEYPSIPCTSGYVIKVKRLTTLQSSGKDVETDAQYILFRSVEPVPLGIQPVPLTDPQIDSMAAAYLASNNRPVEAFSDVSGQPIPDLFADAAVTPLSAVDAATANDLQAYRQGLLQTSDPSAEHYVTPERYDYIKNLAAQQDYQNSDEGKAEALNEKMKQPITQAQYEESNLKTETAQASALSTSLAPAFDPFNQLQLDHDFILEKVNSPSEPPDSLSFFQWSLPTGSCSGFTVDMSVGQGKLYASKNVSEHCPFYNEVAHPLLFWFLNILTFLYVWWIWDRSVSDMAR